MNIIVGVAAPASFVTSDCKFGIEREPQLDCDLRLLEVAERGQCRGKHKGDIGLFRLSSIDPRSQTIAFSWRPSIQTIGDKPKLLDVIGSVKGMADAYRDVALNIRASSVAVMRLGP